MYIHNTLCYIALAVFLIQQLKTFITNLTSFSPLIFFLFFKVIKMLLWIFFKLLLFCYWSNWEHKKLFFLNLVSIHHYSTLKGEPIPG